MGQFIMVGWMVVLFLLIVGLVYRFDPEARRSTVVSNGSDPAAPDEGDQ